MKERPSEALYMTLDCRECVLWARIHAVTGYNAPVRAVNQRRLSLSEKTHRTGVRAGQVARRVRALLIAILARIRNAGSDSR